MFDACVMPEAVFIIIDNTVILLYNEYEKSINRTAILTDIADHRRGMQYVRVNPKPTVWAFQF